MTTSLKVSSLPPLKLLALTFVLRSNLSIGVSVESTTLMCYSFDYFAGNSFLKLQIYCWRHAVCLAEFYHQQLASSVPNVCNLQRIYNTSVNKGRMSQ